MNIMCLPNVYFLILRFLFSSNNPYAVKHLLVLIIFFKRRKTRTKDYTFVGMRNTTIFEYRPPSSAVSSMCVIIPSQETPEQYPIK